MALGGPPLRTEWLADGARKDLVYELAEPSGDWDVTIRVTFTSDEMGVEAIHLIVTRRPSAAPPYLGRTTKGYQPGQPIELARALYGLPDSMLLASPGSAALWWYREAGVVFLPGETVGNERNEARFVVLNPFLSPDDLARIVAWVALGLSLALVTPASPEQPTTARDPFDIVLEGRAELVGVAVTQDGTVYVADRGAGIVYRLSPGGALSPAVSGLDRPAGLALDADSRLLIAEEQAGRILRLEANDTLTVLATDIKTPRWLVVNGDGSLYITAHRLIPPDGADTTEGRTILRLVLGGSPTLIASDINHVEGLARLNGSLIVASKGLAGGPDSAGMLLRYPVLTDGTLGAPTRWVATGLKQPVGLVLDTLATLYVSTKELSLETDIAKRAIGKLHPDLQLTEFAANLSDPQGVALGPDGSLYAADGKAGRLVKFRAPPAPTFTTPAFTNESPLSVTGTTAAGARVDLFVNDGVTPVSVTADTAGAFSASVALALNAANTLQVVATSQGGLGLTSQPGEATIVHDNVGPAVTFYRYQPGLLRTALPAALAVGGSATGDYHALRLP